MEDSNYFNDLAPELLDNGYAVTPIRPNSKAAFLSGWSTCSHNHQQKLLNSIGKKSMNGHGIGIVLGLDAIPAVALDFDVYEPAKAKMLREQLLLDFPDLADCILKIGMGPKFTYILRCAEPPGRRLKSAEFETAGGKSHVDVLVKGCQTVVYGIHPDTGRPYEFPTERTPVNVSRTELRVFAWQTLADMIRLFEDMHGGRPTFTGKSHEDKKPSNPAAPGPAAGEPRCTGEITCRRLGGGEPVGDVLVQAVKKTSLNLSKLLVDGKYQWTGQQLTELFARFPAHWFDDFHFWTYIVNSCKLAADTDEMKTFCDAVCSVSWKFNRKISQDRQWNSAAFGISLGSVVWMSKKFDKFEAADWTNDFISEELAAGEEKGDLIPKAEVHAAYVRWCEKLDLPPVNIKHFGYYMHAAGFEGERRGRQKIHMWRAKFKTAAAGTANADAQPLRSRAFAAAGTRCSLRSAPLFRQTAKLRDSGAGNVPSGVAQPHHLHIIYSDELGYTSSPPPPRNSFFHPTGAVLPSSADFEIANQDEIRQHDSEIMAVIAKIRNHDPTGRRDCSITNLKGV